MSYSKNKQKQFFSINHSCCPGSDWKMTEDILLKAVKAAKKSLDTCVENYLSLAKMFFELAQKIQEICRDENVRNVLKKHSLCN